MEKSALAGRQRTARTYRWVFCSNAAIHFALRSEAAFGLRLIDFSA
jgi:hypothetical protein